MILAGSHAHLGRHMEMSVNTCAAMCDCPSGPLGGLLLKFHKPQPATFTPIILAHKACCVTIS